jgi:hypothetical protein
MEMVRPGAQCAPLVRCQGLHVEIADKRESMPIMLRNNRVCRFLIGVGRRPCAVVY